MAVLTKDDFDSVIANSISKYPSLYPLYQAQDPRIMQPLNAMAAMLTMFSNQIDVSVGEVFRKTRNGTVMADAAMRGIIRKGKPARALVSFKNESNSAFTVDTGRLLSDSTGKPWKVESGGILPAGAQASFPCVQLVDQVVRHVVSVSEPFYAIPIEKDVDETLFIASISVRDSIGELKYKERYVNTLPGERVYHVEVDERERLFIRFGATNIVGFQPAAGHTFNVSTTWTHAASSLPKHQSPFHFDAITNVVDSYIKMSFDQIIEIGVDPVTVSALREIARYPSLYDHNAVFLGEFSFLVKRHFPELVFSTVWNELIEERARGASINHINTLFVAVSESSQISALPIESAGSLVAFSYTPEANLTQKQKDIRSVIQRADGSYRVKFVRPVIRIVSVSILASISRVYSLDVVRNQIAEKLLSKYSVSAASNGATVSVITSSALSALLRGEIESLAIDQSDLRLVVDDDLLPYKPEVIYMITTESLNVTVRHIEAPAFGWKG